MHGTCICHLLGMINFVDAMILLTLICLYSCYMNFCLNDVYGRFITILLYNHNVHSQNKMKQVCLDSVLFIPSPHSNNFHKFLLLCYFLNALIFNGNISLNLVDFPKAAARPLR